MPPLEGYRSRVAPQAGQPLPKVDARDFGAGVADAVGGVARTVHREKIEDARLDQKLERNREWSQFQLGYADLRESMADAAREARQKFDPQHAENMGKILQEREEALLEGISDKEVRDRARSSLATWGAAFRSGEKDWATVRSSEVSTEQFREARDAAANRTRRLESPDDYAVEMLVQLDAIDGLAVPDKVREALRQETEQTLAVAYLQGRIDEDPKLAKAMLDSGAFDEVLDPSQVEALLNGAGVEIRRAEVAASRAVSQEKAEFREAMKLYREESSQGIDRSEAIPGLRETAERLGMADVVAELDGDKADSVFGQVYEGAPPVQLEQRMAQLRVKGDRSDNEDRELAWLERTLPGVETRYIADPVGFHAREGGEDAPPALDFADPSSIVARSRWATARSEVDGRPVPVMSKAEAAQLGSIYESGREGEESVMALLNRLPPSQAMQAARQIDPNDLTLPIVATLPQNTRNAARRGREALKANRRMLSEAIENDIDLAEMWNETREQFDRALVGVPPDQRRAVYETAKQIVAGHMDKTGGAFGERAWHLALNMALGAQGTGADQRGGFAEWGEKWFLLPQGVSKPAFKGAVDRTLQESEDPPVNPDGSRANIYRAFPVAVGPGLYEFRSQRGDPLRKADGVPWRVRVRPR